MTIGYAANLVAAAVAGGLVAASCDILARELMLGLWEHGALLLVASAACVGLALQRG